MLRPNELALFVQNKDHADNCFLWMFAVQLTVDGLQIAQQRCVLQSLNAGSDWIICQAQDTVVLISGPSLNVWRLSLEVSALSYITLNFKLRFRMESFTHILCPVPTSRTTLTRPYLVA